MKKRQLYMKDYNKRYNKKNKEAVKATKKEWYERNKNTDSYKQKRKVIESAYIKRVRHTDEFKAKRKKYSDKYKELYPDRSLGYRLKAYGITLDEYNSIKNNQNNKCAICKVDAAYLKNGLYVDHCHSTNRVRGLLCQKCNSGIAFMKDDPILLENAIMYLNRKTITTPIFL